MRLTSQSRRGLSSSPKENNQGLFRLSENRDASSSSFAAGRGFVLSSNKEAFNLTNASNTNVEAGATSI